MSRSHCLGVICLWVSFLLLATYSHGAPEVAREPSSDVQKIVEEYCVAVSDIATERRLASQNASLKELEARVEDGLARLEKRKAELEALLKRRDDLRNLAQKELVEMYSGMEPEAASLQLEKLDVRLASSVMRQLKPRQASAILNEMNPEFAARMARTIAISAQNGSESQ